MFLFSIEQNSYTFTLRLILFNNTDTGNSFNILFNTTDTENTLYILYYFIFIIIIISLINICPIDTGFNAQLFVNIIPNATNTRPGLEPYACSSLETKLRKTRPS